MSFLLAKIVISPVWALIRTEAFLAWPGYFLRNSMRIASWIWSMRSECL